MMEKRRTIRYSDEEQSNGVNPLHGNPTIVNYSSTTIVNMSDPDSDEKKYLYTKPRFIAVLVSAIILVIYGMFVLSRSDIVHIALFHHTGDYHANNHVVQKIEEHKGLFIHDNRDIDAPPSAPLAARTRTEDPALLTKFGFHEEEFVRSATTTQVMNENKSAAKQDNMVVEDPSGLINNRNSESQKSLPVLNSVDSLKSEMDAQIALVRKMKYEDHVVMEVDSKAKAEIAKLQELVRHYITQVYGEGPFYLEMELQFPVSMQENGRSDTEKIIIELGPIKLIPYSVYYFLQLVENWKGGAFHRRAGHVLQAFISGGRAKTQSLAFQEYHPGFPHVKHTMGYAGRPGGPEFYISTVDNSENHGPGSQGSKTEADSCFGRIVKGFEVIERMKHQPGAGGAGFINSPDNYIRIPTLRRITSPPV